MHDSPTSTQLSYPAARGEIGVNLQILEEKKGNLALKLVKAFPLFLKRLTKLLLSRSLFHCYLVNCLFPFILMRRGIPTDALVDGDIQGEWS